MLPQTSHMDWEARLLSLIVPKRQVLQLAHACTTKKITLQQSIPLFALLDNLILDSFEAFTYGRTKLQTCQNQEIEEAFFNLADQQDLLSSLFLRTQRE